MSKHFNAAVRKAFERLAATDPRLVAWKGSSPWLWPGERAWRWDVAPGVVGWVGSPARG